MIDSRFRKVEETFIALRRELAAGRITAAQLEQALDTATIEHAGRYWMLGANSGRWYASNGQTWIEAQPPQEAPTPAAAPPPQAAPAPPYAAPAQPYPPNAAPAYAAVPKKPSARNWLLGCLLGCVAPLLAVGGVGLIIQGMANGAYSPPTNGVTLLLGATLLTALCVTALLRTIPAAVFVILCLVWIAAAFLALRLGIDIGGLRRATIPDIAFAAGIAAFFGTILGIPLRKWR